IAKELIELHNGEVLKVANIFLPDLWRNSNS
ncbi:unnamed protein product, partial [marine sediment metagenome]